MSDLARWRRYHLSCGRISPSISTTDFVPKKKKRKRMKWTRRWGEAEKRKSGGNRISIWILTTLASTLGTYLSLKITVSIILLHPHRRETDMMVMRSWQGEVNNPTFVCLNSARYTTSYTFFSIIDPSEHFLMVFHWGWKKSQRATTKCYLHIHLSIFNFRLKHKMRREKKVLEKYQKLSHS